MVFTSCLHTVYGQGCGRQRCSYTDGDEIIQQLTEWDRSDDRAGLMHVEVHQMDQGYLAACVSIGV